MLRVEVPMNLSDTPTIVVNALPTPLPGLVCHAAPDVAGVWTLTHARSGAALAFFDHPEAIAGAITEPELTTVDWTASADELQRSGVGAGVMSACRRWGGRNSSYPCLSDPERLAR